MTSFRFSSLVCLESDSRQTQKTYRPLAKKMWPVTLWSMVGVVMLMGLTACENKDRHRGDAGPPSGPEDAPLTRAAPNSFGNESTGRRFQGDYHQQKSSFGPVPQFHGEPMWADNRRGSAEENAKYQFEHRGKDIGATSFDDYLTKVHNFFDHPPKDAKTLVRPRNGDFLIYSESQNLFGVKRKDGAPRLLMHPPSGRSYWEEQLKQNAQEASGG